MFIIIQYRVPNYDKVHIVKYLEHTIIFGSEHTARKYAEEHCLENYKIVEL